MHKDPVCGMTVNPQNTATSVQYRGQTYYFCSQQCKTMFERETEKYIQPERTRFQ
ncbi:MAG: YHS domain-containing protein [Chloroflexota bacterium]